MASFHFFRIIFCFQSSFCVLWALLHICCTYSAIDSETIFQTLTFNIIYSFLYPSIILWYRGQKFRIISPYFHIAPWKIHIRSIIRQSAQYIHFPLSAFSADYRILSIVAQALQIIEELSEIKSCYLWAEEEFSPLFSSWKFFRVVVLSEVRRHCLYSIA